ncbi:MAG: LL-diaminopimelate aminotransferase [Chloroflexi bacterium]|nr:LL-diaminopimelate aminotransferase [Chloroflexota bacterium]
MNLAKRVQDLPPYLFAAISKKIAQKKAEGVDVISFAIGDPDLPTPPHILDSLVQAARDPANQGYPDSDGLPEYRKAVADWYKRRFGVAFDPDKEVLPLIGSKEGLGHIPLCFIDPGDVALVPDPGYPVYPVSVQLAGGTVHALPLTQEQDFLPDFDAVPADVANKAKLLFLNYPSNPTSAIADVAFFERAVAFAKQHDIVVVHDMAYSEIAYDEYVPPSFMEATGARDVGIEVHSLSKSYNMTGWRIGMAVGNADLIDALARVKSNLDSGIPNAIQRMAITALEGPQESIQENNAVYQRRRDTLVDAVRSAGLEVIPPKASLYLWCRLPDGMGSIDFAAKLLDDTGVVVTPGVGYGKHGEGYVRLSLTVPDDRLQEGIRRLKAWRAT